MLALGLEISRDRPETWPNSRPRGGEEASNALKYGARSMLSTRPCRFARLLLELPFSNGHMSDKFLNYSDWLLHWLASDSTKPCSMSRCVCKFMALEKDLFGWFCTPLDLLDLCQMRHVLDEMWFNVRIEIDKLINCLRPRTCVTTRLRDGTSQSTRAENSNFTPCQPVQSAC